MRLSVTPPTSESLARYCRFRHLTGLKLTLIYLENLACRSWQYAWNGLCHQIFGPRLSGILFFICRCCVGLSFVGGIRFPLHFVVILKTSSYAQAVRAESSSSFLITLFGGISQLCSSQRMLTGWTSTAVKSNFALYISYGIHHLTIGDLNSSPRQTAHQG